MVETGTQNMGLGVLPTRTVVFHGDSPLEKLVTVLKLNAKFFLHFLSKVLLWNLGKSSNMIRKFVGKK